MRFSLVVVPAFLLLLSTGYYMARPKALGGPAANEMRLDRLPGASDDSTADENDAQLVRKALNTKNLTEADAAGMVQAAGRRYMRRKIAYTTALESGKAKPEALDWLRKDMEL